jgi:restriction system protein
MCLPCSDHERGLRLCRERRDYAVAHGYFQCKRYKGTVTPGVVRDFRCAMAGRGEKGLLITTGSFTREAQAEATHDGAPPVELIDGDRLCDLLKEFRLGVELRERIEQDVTVNPGFFDEYQ